MLGMYDMPEIHSANDAIWSAVRSAIGAGPAQLDRSSDFWEIWHSPDLVLGQTCGLPYRARLMGQVQKIATPDYALPGCPPGYYASAFVVREDSPFRSLTDLDGALLAFNEGMSQSGWAGPMSKLARQGIRPGGLLETGAHVRSLAAVAAGRADVTAADMQTIRLITQSGTMPAGLRQIGATDPTPGLPYICAPAQDAGRLRTALQDAIALPAAAPLGIAALVDIPEDVYAAVPTPPAPQDSGLPLRHLSDEAL